MTVIAGQHITFDAFQHKLLAHKISMSTTHAEGQSFNTANISNNFLQALQNFIHPRMVVRIQIGQLGNVITTTTPGYIAQVGIIIND